MRLKKNISIKFFSDKIKIIKLGKILILISIVFLTGCAGCPYSFTGASLPTEFKSVAIPILDDMSGTGEIGLRETLTQKLVTKFTNDNTLKVIDKKYSDTILEGEITSVRDEFSTIAGNDKVTTRRITISVKFKFTDLRNRKKIWDKSFSNWGDYDASGGGIPNRQVGFNTAIEKITEDILLGTVSDW